MPSFTQFTTPTKEIVIYGVDLTDAMVTIRLTQNVGGIQNSHIVDVDVDAAAVTYEDGASHILFTLTQADTGGFLPGTVNVQLNFMLETGYRDASNIAKMMCNPNTRDEVIEYE